MRLTVLPRRPVLLLLGAGALAGALPGCGFLSMGPTNVAQGKYFSAGHPEYDQFFIKLHQLQLKMANAPDELNRIEASLADSLELGTGISRESMFDKLSAVAARLQDAGTHVALVVEEANADGPSVPGPKTALFRKGGKSSAEVTKFTEAVETASNATLQLSFELEVASRNLAKLKVRSIELLASLDTAFADSPLHSVTVKKNLEDAGKVLELMVARTDELSQSAEALQALLVEASDTDDGSLRAPSPPVEKPSTEQRIVEPAKPRPPPPKRNRRSPRVNKPPAKPIQQRLDFEP